MSEDPDVEAALDEDSELVGEPVEDCEAGEELVDGSDVDDDDEVPAENAEGGRYWQLQPHWPATAKSSISSIKFDPKDAHTVRRRISIPMQSLKPAS